MGFCGDLDYGFMRSGDRNIGGFRVENGVVWGLLCIHSTFLKGGFLFFILFLFVFWYDN